MKNKHAATRKPLLITTDSEMRALLRCTNRVVSKLVAADGFPMPPPMLPEVQFAKPNAELISQRNELNKELFEISEEVKRLMDTYRAQKFRRVRAAMKQRSWLLRQLPLALRLLF